MCSWSFTLVVVCDLWLTFTFLDFGRMSEFGKPISILLSFVSRVYYLKNELSNSRILASDL